MVYLCLVIIATWKFPLCLPRCAPVLPTLRFTREFVLGFFADYRVFLKTCRLLVFAESCLLLGLFFADFVMRIALFANFMALLLFTANAIWACLCVNLLILGLFCEFVSLVLFLIFYWLFVLFPDKRLLGLFFG